MIRTGGNWDPKGEPIYFIASSPGTVDRGLRSHDSALVAVNEISTDEDVALIESWCKRGVKVFLDSGVFNLANSHARTHGISMDEALQLAPTQIDGFAALYERYCKLIDRLGEQVWGYIEVDQGGRANKKKTRRRLENRGLRPIPVYHPLNDGWNYFDELAKNYDRICFGNIVQADQATRKRLLATAWERKRKYPHLWIHLLGMTPNQWMNALPINSADSSSWLCLMRWSSAFQCKAMLQNFTAFSPELFYSYGTDADADDGHGKATQLGGYDANMIARMWRQHATELNEVLGE